MIHSRTLGDTRITGVIEYSGPTHDPAQTFADFDPAVAERERAWLAPHHWIPAMNRLIVTIQMWVVHHAGRIIVIDTGVGNRKPRPRVERMDNLYTLTLPWLEAAGAAPDRVTDVVITHLHTDHVGWNTVQRDGLWVPTFPNARYHLSGTDLAWFGERFAAGTWEGVGFDDSVQPVVDAGLVDIVDGTGDIAGLGVVPLAGHTPGQFGLHLKTPAGDALFCGDLLHSPLQIVRPDWNTPFCADQDRARATRRALLDTIADSGTLLLPAHFGAPFGGYVRRRPDGGFGFDPAWQGFAWGE